ncbi:PTS system ascorbate-specific IIB component [Sporomusaceae bacterium BoRhaA]|uniref:PTS sugar transporter subunit IIB n=1 Tax=Pelorhabdus rhamnosifermentans TaxID=2772457 RepID=UPI001C063EDE|nr:PTS sugar transporter subunit IIB [Pelorhabdus rhamnosifermentans]MBU2701290.1 PTS system ascorbate-specific IIB component [Pelorhabdus rhamnosifermentans]
MKKKIKMLMVCGAGLGSSFACQMSVEDVLNKMGVEADLDHCDISSAVSMNPEVIITAMNFKTQFEQFTISDTTTILYLKNIVSKAEIEEKLTPLLKAKGVL